MRLDHLLSKELPTLAWPAFAGGWVVQVPRHRRTCGGWLLMGGTLTKESSGLAGVSTCRPAGVLRGLVGGGGTSLVRSGGLVEHTVGSSGHRPPVGGVPGTGRSFDHEPLSWLFVAVLPSGGVGAGVLGW